MKLTTQMPSSTSLRPNLWPAMTVEMLNFFRCMQMRPQLVTVTSRSWKVWHRTVHRGRTGDSAIGANDASLDRERRHRQHIHLHP